MFVGEKELANVLLEISRTDKDDRKKTIIIASCHSRLEDIVSVEIIEALSRKNIEVIHQQQENELASPFKFDTEKAMLDAIFSKSKSNKASTFEDEGYGKISYQKRQKLERRKFKR